MDVANTAESDRPSRRMPAAAVASEPSERDEHAPVSASNKRQGRGSWAPPRPQLPAPNLRRRHLEPIRHFGRLSARSAPMVEVFDVMRRFAQTEVTVTLVGETGAGKDVKAPVLQAQRT